MSVIFLAGVHGVGKGYLGSRVATSLGLLHLTASQLIREEKGRATWTKEKLVTEVEYNQLALIHAVNRRIDLVESLLLDGHFVLRNSTGHIVQLSVDVFAKLHLAGVIVLSEDSEVIAKRLADRDGVSVSLESIAELIHAEISHAVAVCNMLRIPLLTIERPTEPLLTQAVRKILKK